MMCIIREFRLEITSDLQIIEVPNYSRFLSMGVQEHRPCLWFQCPAKSSTNMKKHYKVVPNNVEFQDAQLLFIGTIHDHVPQMVWHIYER